MPGLPPVKVEAPPGVMGLRHHSALSARATMTNPAQYFGRAQPRKKKNSMELLGKLPSKFTHRLRSTAPGKCADLLLIKKIKICIWAQEEATLQFLDKIGRHRQQANSRLATCFQQTPHR
jgi:hypothetical protein